MSRKKRERKNRRLHQQHMQEAQRAQELLLKKAQRTLPTEAVVIRDPQGMKKMSEALAEFAGPFFDHADRFEDEKKVFTLAALAWNLSLMSPISRWIELHKISTAVTPSDDPQLRREFQLILKRMIRRKKREFSDIKRWIVDWQYIQTSSGGTHLNVVSTLLEESSDHQQSNFLGQTQESHPSSALHS